MNEPGIVIVGAGAAGMAAAGELRRLGHPGPITVVHGEAGLPYNRTAVNKALLQGTLTADDLILPEAATPGLEWTGVDPAVGLDTATRTITFATGRSLRYQRLIVATGAEPRPFPGTATTQAQKRILTLRTARDAERLREQLSQLAATRPGLPPRVAILGTGLIGSETAGALAAAGADVTVIGVTSLPMIEQAGRTTGDWLARRHAEHVRTRFGRSITAVDADDDAELIATLTCGEQIRCDLLLVCIGVTPCTGWLAGSGLELSDGIAVDGRLRARGADAVYAAGDLARITDDDGRGHRTEHWLTASQQGQHAARALLHDTGVLDTDPGDYAHLPTYSTRLYGTSVVVNGNAHGFVNETVIAGTPSAGRFTVALTDADDAVIGVIGVGGGKLANALKDTIQRREPLSRAIDVVSAG